MVPWGTPIVRAFGVDKVPLYLTICVRFVKYDLNQSCSVPLIPKEDSLLRSKEWGTSIIETLSLWNRQFWPTWYTIIHIRIIQNISGEITSSDWPDTQLYINYRDHIWWNHQFWLTWYTIIHQLKRPYLVKSPVLTDLIHNHISIIETISGEITSSDRPGTQSYISELYRTYLVKSPVLTDLVHNHRLEL